MVKLQLTKAGITAGGVALSASVAALYCYCRDEAQHKALATTLPDMLAEYSVIVKYRGPSRRVTLIELS